MAKAPTLCLEEEEEACSTAVTGSGPSTESTPNSTSRQEGVESEPEETTSARDQEPEGNGNNNRNRPRAATENLNSTDVIVPTHSFVEEDHRVID